MNLIVIFWSREIKKSTMLFTTSHLYMVYMRTSHSLNATPRVGKTFLLSYKIKYTENVKPYSRKIIQIYLN